MKKCFSNLGYWQSKHFPRTSLLSVEHLLFCYCCSKTKCPKPGISQSHDVLNALNAVAWKFLLCFCSFSFKGRQATKTSSPANLHQLTTPKHPQNFVPELPFVEDSRTTLKLWSLFSWLHLCAEGWGLGWFIVLAVGNWYLTRLSKVLFKHNILKPSSFFNPTVL